MPQRPESGLVGASPEDAKNMATKWWSMSPREKSIAKRRDKEYVNENGSCKDFDKDVWKASCKWQRRMRAHYEKTVINLGEAVAVSSSQSTDNPNTLEIGESQFCYEDDHALGELDDEDDSEGRDLNIVDVYSQKIQAKFEGIQKDLHEKDEIHQEEKQMMLEKHEQELEHQRQALGK
jgi:hypothetical protein